MVLKPKQSKLMSSDNIGSFSSSFELESSDFNYDFNDIISAEGSLFALIRVRQLT